MTSNCWTSVRGTRARVTKVDACCYPVAGACSQAVTKGFITVSYSPQITEGEDIEVKNADGAVCVLDKGCDELTRYDVEIEFCGVEPELLTMLTGNPLVVDYAGKGTGYRVGEVIQCEAGFALEVWTRIPNKPCSRTTPPAGVQYGYFLVPCLSSASLMDFTIENGALSVKVKARSRSGSLWGRGPYNVVAADAALTPGRLLTAIGTREHMHVDITDIPAPDAVCGCLPLVLPTPYFP